MLSSLPTMLYLILLDTMIPQGSTIGNVGPKLIMTLNKYYVLQRIVDLNAETAQVFQTEAKR